MLSALKQKCPELHEKAKQVYNDFYFYGHSFVGGIKRNFSGNKSLVDKLLMEYPMIPSKMVSKNHIKIVLEKLYNTLEQGIEGDVVELGCNVGTTSLFIRKLLNSYGLEKEFHVYDSWEGLPEESDKDVSNNKRFDKGSCKTRKGIFTHNFELAKLKLPEIHSGWFKKIPDKEYPEKISFAFFDGDFYDSILDSFSKVYSRLTSGAIVTIHDYEATFLPGVKKACTEFLSDKPEKGTMVNARNYNIGVMIKK